MNSTTPETETKRFTLYSSRYCGYCIWVRRAAEDLGVALNIVDVNGDPAARAMLWERRGRGTVPVLGIPDEAGGERLLGESRDIVAFLKAEVARHKGGGL